MKLSILVIVLVLGPGFVLSHLIRAITRTFFTSLVLSLSFFSVTLLFAEAAQSLVPFFVAYGLLAGLSIVIALKRRDFLLSSLKILPSLETISKILRTPETLIIALFSTYYYFAGPYLEVPADVWNHLGAIRDYSADLGKGIINSHQPWYFLLALSAHLCGQAVSDQIHAIGFFLQVLFVIGIATFVRGLAAPHWANGSSLYCYVFLSTLLTILTFGTSVFAFFSYYVFAPVFINFNLVLYSALLIFPFKHALETTISDNLRCLLLICALLVSYFFHKQEALLIVVLLWSYGAIAFYRGVRIGLTHSIQMINFASARSIFGIFCSALFLFTIIFGVLQIFSNSSAPTPLVNNTIDIASFLIQDSPILIASPTGRVLETVNFWGILVICFYFLFVARDARAPALTAMAVAPYAILFNPLFANSLISIIPQETLWRLSYLTPFGILATHTLFFTVKFLHWRSPVTLFTLLLVCIPLSPVQPSERWTPSRYNTLAPLDNRRTSQLWDDLFRQLSKIGSRNVLTDPVTCYLVNALTQSKCFGFKFYGAGNFIPINYDYFGKNHFVDFHGWLLIVNKRDGIVSENGAISGHWSTDIMITSKNYSSKLDDFLSTQPAHFSQLWQSDQISIYQIE